MGVPYVDVPWVLKFRLTEYQVVEVPPYRVPGGDLVNIIGKARAPSKHFWGGMWSACGFALGLILNPRCYHAFDTLKSLQHTRIQIIFCGTHRVLWCWYSALASTEHRGILMWPTPRTTEYRMLSWPAVPSTTVYGREPHRGVQLSTVCAVARVDWGWL